MNNSKIKGNENLVFQKIDKKINKSNDSKGNVWVIVGIIIAIFALISQTLIGWEEIVKFLKI